jgi:hypothetical protein
VERQFGAIRNCTVSAFLRNNPYDRPIFAQYGFGPDGRARAHVDERRRRFLMDKLPPGILATGTAVSFLIVLFTYQLNTGPFNFHLYNHVFIIRPIFSRLD